MKKNWLTLASVALLSTVTLSACDGSSSAAPKTKDGKVEVEFWFAGGKTAVNVWKDIIKEYNASQDKYEIKAVTQADYEETYTKLQAAIAGNKAPDLVLLDTAPSRNLDKKKLLADINSLAKDDKDFKADNYVKVFADQGTNKEGKRYGLPAYGTTQVMYYNKEAFKAANIQPESIKTWEDMGKAAKAIKDTVKFTYGWEPMWGPYNLIDASLSNDAKMFSEDGK